MISKVLIVGATGKLGGSIARRLLEQRHSVRALVRDPARAEALRAQGAELMQGDMRDEASLRAACAGVSHVVATANAFLSHYRNSSADVDLRGNMRLIDVCVAEGVDRFVYVTGAITSADSKTDFFRHKYASEKHLEKSGLDYITVRAAAFMDEWTEIVAGKIPTKGVATIFGDGTNPINFVAREDVAAFVVRILDDPRVSREPITLGGPEDLRIIDLVDKYEQHTGLKARRKHIPVPAMRVLRHVLAVDPMLRRLMSAGIDIATVDQKIDVAPLHARFPDLRLQTMDEWLRTSR